VFHVKHFISHFLVLPNVKQSAGWRITPVLQKFGKINPRIAPPHPVISYFSPALSSQSASRRTRNLFLLRIPRFHSASLRCTRDDRLTVSSSRAPTQSQSHCHSGLSLSVRWRTLRGHPPSARVVIPDLIRNLVSKNKILKRVQDDTKSGVFPALSFRPKSVRLLAERDL